jgi:hypothetical protein
MQAIAKRNEKLTAVLYMPLTLTELSLNYVQISLQYEWQNRWAR